MTTLAEERQRYSEALARDLDQVVAQLSRIAAVEQVILFGSYAAGRIDLFTDLDILVVMPSALDFVSRGADLARQLEVGAPLDLLVYTPEEMALLRQRPFFKHLFKTSKVLYEKKSS